MVTNNLQQVILNWSAKYKTKLTLRMLARATGISDQVLGKMARNGKQKIYLDQLDRLCEVLECAPGDILVYQPNSPRVTQPLVPDSAAAGRK